LPTEKKLKVEVSMKIKTLSLLVLLVFVANAAAEKQARESDPEPSMETGYGIRAGTNWSSIDHYPSSVLGWQVGGAMDIPLKPIRLGRKHALINLQPEAMLVAKGGDYDYILFRMGYEARAYFLEVPVSASFKFFVNENFSVRLDLGPYFDLGLFGEKTEPAPYGKSSTFKDGYWKGLSRFNFGRHEGIAIQWSNYYFAATESSSFTDNVSSTYLTLGYNF